jgi:flagellar FliL protein
VSEDATGTEGGEAPKGGGKLVLAMVLVGTLVLGGGAGWIVVGPKLAGGAPAAEHEEGAEDEGGGHGKKKGGHGGAEESTIYAIENLVVNPAGTQGTRFLIVTLAVETDGTAAMDRLKAAEAQVRDALQAVLGSKSVEQLSDIAQRDSVKAEMKTVLEKILKPGKVVGLYLPQYVLQ